MNLAALPLVLLWLVLVPVGATVVLGTLFVLFIHLPRQRHDLNPRPLQGSEAEFYLQEVHDLGLAFDAAPRRVLARAATMVAELHRRIGIEAYGRRRLEDWDPDAAEALRRAQQLAARATTAADMSAAWEEYQLVLGRLLQVDQPAAGAPPEPQAMAFTSTARPHHPSLP